MSSSWSQVSLSTAYAATWSRKECNKRSSDFLIYKLTSLFPSKMANVSFIGLNVRDCIIAEKTVSSSKQQVEFEWHLMLLCTHSEQAWKNVWPMWPCLFPVQKRWNYNSNHWAKRLRVLFRPYCGKKLYNCDPTLLLVKTIQLTNYTEVTTVAGFFFRNNSCGLTNFFSPKKSPNYFINNYDFWIFESRGNLLFWVVGIMVIKSLFGYKCTVCLIRHRWRWAK